MALSANQVIEAKALRRQNPPVRWTELARMYGVTATSVRMACDLYYYEKRKRQINDRRNERRGNRLKASANPTGDNGSQIMRLRKKANFATFRATWGPPPLVAEKIPLMDDADIAGVDYHANEGCKYILGDRRGGPSGLPLCCGGERVNRWVNGTEIKLPYCNLHALRTGTRNYGGRR